MLSNEPKISLFDMVLCFSRALDLLHPSISDHHLRVAYIASCLAEQLGLGTQDAQDTLIAGALHDVAAVSSAERHGLLDYALRHYKFNPDRIDAPESVHAHGLGGYLLLRDFAPFSRAAPAIRFHHVDWDFGRGREFAGESVPAIAHILHLADRIAVLPVASSTILEQARAMHAQVLADAGRLFQPEIVAAFDHLAQKESFWLDIASQYKEEIIRARFGRQMINLDMRALHQLAMVFGNIIDYRSPFTATHSSGVAAIAQALAGRFGMSASQRHLIGIAGHLHDIGKLAVPSEILNKPGKLTDEEMRIIKQHPYHTHRILSMVPGLETVNTWASLHHERLDGAGYPFRTADIPLGARIIAVADVFTAITESRPYRKGMARDMALSVIEKMVHERAIDGDIVAVLKENFDEFNRIRSQSQQVGRAALLAL